MPHLCRKYTLPASQPVASTHDCAGTGGVLGGFLQTSDVSSSLENPEICVPLLNHRDVLGGSKKLSSRARVWRFPALKQSSLLSSPENPDLSLALYRRTSHPQDPGLKILGADFLGAAGPSLSSPTISPAKRAPQPSSPFNLSWHPLPPPRQGEENSPLLYQNRHKGRVM